jgi:hypothetical protein
MAHGAPRCVLILSDGPLRSDRAGRNRKERQCQSDDAAGYAFHLGPPACLDSAPIRAASMASRRDAIVDTDQLIRGPHLAGADTALPAYWRRGEPNLVLIYVKLHPRNPAHCINVI